MMKGKMLVTAVVSAVVSSVMVLPSFAGNWHDSGNGMIYYDGNGGWHSNGWYWVDGDNDGTAECYYFDENGRMLADMVTPDGYQVNVDGAWVLDGQVQTQTQVRAAVDDGFIGSWVLSEIKVGYTKSPDKLYSFDSYSSISNSRLTMEDAKYLYSGGFDIFNMGSGTFVGTAGDVAANQIDQFKEGVLIRRFGEADCRYYVLDGNDLYVISTDSYQVINADKSGSYYILRYERSVNP